MKDTENIGIENIDIETAINLKASIDRTLTAIEAFNTGVQILLDEVKPKNRKLEKLSKRGQSDPALKASVDKAITAIDAINTGIKILIDEVSQKNSELEKMLPDV